jgi:predicted TIM-barrel fold metal-dependent hydrolase
MSENGRDRSARDVVYNVDGILDAHTHLTGQESAEEILVYMDFCGIEKAFLFAPMLDVQAHEITSDNLEDIRTHNDYCADVCSTAPDRLLGFCTLNPMPAFEDGDLDRAVGLMVEGAERCCRELGLRGAGELVPTHWYPHDPALVRLRRTLADLRMYTIFHAGIFYDGRQSTYCRPAYFEAVRQAPGFKGHIAHACCCAPSSVGRPGYGPTRRSPTSPRCSGSTTRAFPRGERSVSTALTSTASGNRWTGS